MYCSQCLHLVDNEPVTQVREHGTDVDDVRQKVDRVQRRVRLQYLELLDASDCVLHPDARV